MKKIIFQISTAIILLFFIVILMAPGYLEQLRDHFIIHILRLVLIIYLMSIITNIFYGQIFKNDSIKGGIKNISLSIYMMVILLLIIETVFMFVPESHSTSNTLAGRNWFSLYWKTNSMGFRDDELKEKNLTKKKIFFVGDSFTAGHGLKKISQRFSNITGEKLNNQYEFFNLGINGADTDDEYKTLIDFPVKPDVVVLQYFFNDIDNASKRAGSWKPFPMIYSDIPLWQRPLVRGSFLLNFIYWKFPHSGEYDYLAELKKAYSNSLILKDHLLSLKKFTDYAYANNIKLYVVMFPFLQNLDVSNQLAVPVKQYFTSENVDVIEVSKLVTDLPIKDRVVNVNDFHSSPLVNERVAQAITNLITK
jgi:hypothetical protein